jgi:deazaflavin-dependent oxidoreductase (nitroreductase family)
MAARNLAARMMAAYRWMLARTAGTRTGVKFYRWALPRADALVLRVTGGRRTFANHAVPTLVLTTAGRVSGLPRSSPLCYLRDGADLVVVGTNWGQAHHPAWTANLLAEPRARVMVDGQVIPVVGRLVAEPEWELLYRRFEGMAVNYSSYRAWAGGRVPRLFRLSPAAG